MLEESFLLMGSLMTCDVGKGRVVETTRNGLVQYVKGEPGRWRAVKREVSNPDATHVTTHTRPACRKPMASGRGCQLVSGGRAWHLASIATILVRLMAMGFGATTCDVRFGHATAKVS